MNIILGVKIARLYRINFFSNFVFHSCDNRRFQEGNISIVRTSLSLYKIRRKPAKTSLSNYRLIGDQTPSIGDKLDGITCCLQRLIAAQITCFSALRKNDLINIARPGAGHSGQGVYKRKTRPLLFRNCIIKGLHNTDHWYKGDFGHYVEELVAI